MNNLKIVPYNIGDNSAALELEGHCPQGESFSLRYIRQLFHSRSEVYDNYTILTLRSDDKLVGIAAGAEKIVSLKGRSIKAVYGYDLRIHPEYRKYGAAKLLSGSVVEHFGNDVECTYSLVSGENRRAVEFVRRGLGAKVVIPLTYVIISVHKKYKTNARCREIDFYEAHTAYLQREQKLQFVPAMNLSRMSGYVSSLMINEGISASIWSNENILAESIAKMPFHYEFLAKLQRPLKPFIKFPKIPVINEIIKSWFLFDLNAADCRDLYDLIRVINNLALENKKDFIYILLQQDSIIIDWLKKINIKSINFPYFFMAAGNLVPDLSDKIYIDIRDL
jgi:ribosomal protein S18 acetylase RimI-like enzyme